MKRGTPEESALERSRARRGRQFAPREEAPLVPRAVAECDARALRGNYDAIRALVPGQSVIPMVKADGYGHGAEWVATTLAGSPGLYAFGVATLEEGAALREALGSRPRGGRAARIVVFSGCAPWSDEKGQFCERHGLVPALVTDADWHEFARGGWPARIEYELKFNTGMNRLGLSLGMARTVARALRDQRVESHPAGVFSHLAQAEDPSSRLSRQQLERFVALKAELAPAFPSAQFHLANSGGIWNQRQWGLDGLTDAVRPGISLYGVPPWAGAPERGLVPVLTFKATVVSTQLLRPGESIGYGATFRVAAKDDPVRAAILSAGYADGVSRMLSNQGHAWLGSGPTRFLGIVSMDLSAVAAPSGTRPGDQAEILGPRVDIWAQARAAGTIPYELLTSLSGRVKRIRR